MEDHDILALFQRRDEAAIAETKAKYGRYCFAIAQNILADRADAEECEADAYLDAWNRIPPEKPRVFPAFLGRLVRDRALDRYRRRSAQKRGGGETALSLDELAECLPDAHGVEESVDAAELARLITAFLRGLPEDDAILFLRRYWYFDSVEQLCRRFSLGKSAVKMRLQRIRGKLKRYLEEEDYIV